jgi:hypothetical protein
MAEQRSKAEQLIEAVVKNGESPAELIEKVSNTYSPQWGQNYPYAASVQQGHTGKPRPDMGETPSLPENHETPIKTHPAYMDSDNYHYPLANVVQWPRGSHETSSVRDDHDDEQKQAKLRGYRRSPNKTSY